MDAKERLLAALRREIPDRLPATVHQWQSSHLRDHMGGIDQLEAFLEVGLDASVTPWVMLPGQSPTWDVTTIEKREQDGIETTRFRVRTPDGDLFWTYASNNITTFTTEHLLKTRQDAEIFVRHWPMPRIDRERLAHWRERTGRHGIVRGFVGHFGQPGVWQDICELYGTQQAIMLAMDEPEFVHWLLDQLTEMRVKWIPENLPGTGYDLIEHGGGTASCSVISPKMFDEFCVPYDRRVIDALHAHNFPVVYHTCGGMTRIVDRIWRNGCDASETLSPPGVGGDIRTPADRAAVKQQLGSRVALIGGIDQNLILTSGTPAMVEAEVEACFAAFGGGGGYICSPSDHFFSSPVENLRALARAASRCRY